MKWSNKSGRLPAGSGSFVGSVGMPTLKKLPNFKHNEIKDKNQ
jgi:hypothetical protein